MKNHLIAKQLLAIAKQLLDESTAGPRQDNYPDKTGDHYYSQPQPNKHPEKPGDKSKDSGKSDPHHGGGGGGIYERYPQRGGDDDPQGAPFYSHN